jgi:hypothetical protein
MRSRVLCSGLLILLAGAALGPGAPLDPETRAVEGKLEPYRDHTFWRRFSGGGSKAEVIAVGKGSGLLGLYVYDADGNCVGHDDDVTQRTLDDAVVHWVPARTDLYTIEVRSLSRHENTFLMTVRQGEAGQGGAAEEHK